MRTALDTRLAEQIDGLKAAGTYKTLRHLDSPMAAHTSMREAGGEVIVMSSNNYLGLADHPAVVQGSIDAVKKYGAGTASVRFICGTMTLHEELETELAKLHKTEAAMTYSSCFAASMGLFAPLTQPGDVIISDELNHACIIDGMRLVKKGVEKTVYRHSDMAHLKELLEQHKNAPARLIVTDGVFSMEGDIANLPEIVKLAKQYSATVIVDDSHGVGVMGKTGRGTAEHYGLMDEVDITTGTLGKALGGAAGGYVAGRKHVIDMLVQASRTHIFSNGISPATAGGAMAAVKTMLGNPKMVDTLHSNTQYFRDGLQKRGFKPLDGESAIVPIIVGDTAFAISIADKLLKKGVFVTGFGFPVVPEGTARIRVQISAALSKSDMDTVLNALESVGREVGLLKGAA
ncbi:MAG: glycine C-acetyltransferase [Proteobacteria bacterium]|nr:glycine C-acetyltransferase [Pseudomonadota bacterium]